MTAVVGVIFIGISIAGYLKKDMILPLRVIMFLGGACMFIPSYFASLIGLAFCAGSLILSNLTGNIGKAVVSEIIP